MPSGADAVVMQEDVTAAGNEIVINTDIDPGEFVRKRGCDLVRGKKSWAKANESAQPFSLCLHRKVLASRDWRRTPRGHHFHGR